MRVDVEDNRVINDVSLRARDFVCEGDDRVANLLEIGEFLSLDLLGELGPGLLALGLMVETELEGSTGDQTVTSWQEVEADD